MYRGPGGPGPAVARHFVPRGAGMAHNGAMNPTRPLSFLLAALLSACAASPHRDAGAGHARDGVAFVVVRHGEKASDTGRDPDLSAAGRERARALARRLEGSGLVAVYATGFRRTHQTVRPAADAHGLAIATYDASVPAADLAAQLRAAHGHGTVLVAGHSNTVPDIVAALCNCEVEPMPETEYDRLSTVHVTADGNARLVVERYGAPAHP